MEFQKFPKIPRIDKNIITITEKLDGTNAQITIIPDLLEEDIYGLFYDDDETYHTVSDTSAEGYHTVIIAGSRNRYLTEKEDNYSFRRWVVANDRELCKLGQGTHYGEWYGLDINRGYGLAEKRFALFNTLRWGSHNPNTPKCCEVVPVLHKGSVPPDEALDDLWVSGSIAAPGYMNPEGIVIFNSATKSYLKLTFDTPEGKWKI